MGKSLHKGCGGEIEKGKCGKCGKALSLLERLIGSKVEASKRGFDSSEYKRRIREGRDL